MEWFDQARLWGLSVSEIAVAAASALLLYAAMLFGLRAAMQRASRFAGQTRTRADDAIVEMLAGTNRWLLALAALLVGAGMLDLPARWASRIGQLWFVALALQAALWADRLVVIALRRHAERHGQSATGSAAATLTSWGLRTLLWSILLLAVLSNLGVNITAFVASLGVGGIAVALAAQTILGDLFASLSIAVDKPFEVGDFIVLGNVSGTVEHVGVKTTRIRALAGEQIVMSNTELLKNTISNYKRLQKRRIVFGFGVTYDTTAEQAEAIPGIVRRIVEAGSQLRFDRAHLKGFGESSLDYEVVYTVLVPEHDVYMDEQQRINLALMRELSALGVGFAFPTRTVYVVPPSGTDDDTGGRGAINATRPAQAASAQTMTAPEGRSNHADSARPDA